MATDFPAESYIVPRNARAVQQQMFLSCLFVFGGLFIAVTGRSTVVRGIGVVTGAFFAYGAAWAIKHRHDGPEMALSHDGIHHRELGLIPWSRVGSIRRRQFGRYLYIKVDDLLGAARDNGIHLPLLERLRFLIVQRSLVIPGQMVRPATLAQVEAEIAKWSGRPIDAGAS
jgi:hypothetical protein